MRRTDVMILFVVALLLALRYGLGDIMEIDFVLLSIAIVGSHMAFRRW